MPRRALLLWSVYGFIVLLVLSSFALLVWFFLGPKGPALPWKTIGPVPTTVQTGRPTEEPTPGAPVSPRPTEGFTPGAPVSPQPTQKSTLQIIPLPTATTATTPPPVSTPGAYPSPGTPRVTVAPATPGSTAAPATVAPTAPGPQSGDGQDTARRIADTVLPPRDLVEIAGRLEYGGNTPPRTIPPDSKPYVVGRQDTFWVSDPSLDRQRTISATLQLVTDHLYMYVENDLDTKYGLDVSMHDLQSAAQTFENKIYPGDRTAFGSEWTPGVDGDPHLVILNAVFDGAAGYYSSQDEVPRAVNSSSNQHEMFYMNLEAFDVGDPAYESTLAHEFQHMIHWHEDAQGESWVNEGLAQMAEQINGYSASDIAWYFLYEPDMQLTTWSDEPDTAMPHYAASYLWFRYFADRLGGTQILSSLLDPNLNDIAALNRALAENNYKPAVTAPSLFDSFFADWAITNYLNDPTVGDGRYTYDPDLDIETVWNTNFVDNLPSTIASTVFPYGTDYIEVGGYEKGTLHLNFQGDTTIPLVEAQPHSGSHVWWSNRGDMADSTLTRPVDLKSVTQATLRYWLWYQIEDNYDYAYVEASTDGGKSWTLLTGRYMTADNPNGNNLGQGYTGNSGGGEEAEWVQEQVDLTAFAGKEILLRFEMVTDDAFTRPGLALDDLEITEIGLKDDMESESGWDSQGWIWTDNIVPLNYIVQVITVGSDGHSTVQQFPLNASQQGEITIPNFGQGVSRIVLAVSAVAPVTTEPANYRVQVTLE